MYKSYSLLLIARGMHAGHIVQWWSAVKASAVVTEGSSERKIYGCTINFRWQFTIYRVGRLMNEASLLYPFLLSSTSDLLLYHLLLMMLCSVDD